MTKGKKKKVKVREFADGFLDSLLKGDVLNQIRWVTNAYPLSDLRDVAVGYIIGATTMKLYDYGGIKAIIDDAEFTSKDFDIVMQQVFREKLPEIIDKIEKDFCT